MSSTTNSTHQLRLVLEQNGLINLFAVSFAFLLFIRNRRGFHERLLLATSLASFVADCLLVFTSVPYEEVMERLPSIRVMTFIEVIGWSIRELGLTLYTNKIVSVLDVRNAQTLYHRVFRGLLGLLITWRLIDMCLRTADPTAMNTPGKVVKTVDPIYLGMLSVLELWSAAFLMRLTIAHMRETDASTNVNVFSKRILSTGVFRVVATNLFPAIRLIMNQTISSSFNYGADASSIIYYLQVSMNLMYLIDLVMVKMDSESIFRPPRTQVSSGNQMRTAAGSVKKGDRSDVKNVGKTEIGSGEKGVRVAVVTARLGASEIV
ncbi:uncharacterized protein EV422DRAFT_516150 [Fimicolochytrium jonesii]|uniref:uncharacterized protein n=1 Tax=Fimicolochytrium jonesii TaxID=1396493 RepID=UPI0022FEE805|nr:uncharacterized protein EV422DRAFT_516150 [Fimicolochytrium jonesii]KAI8824774.1 hypothetical protein EV422DRAFT_516150 [Fimicolochytrium jonesii]